MDCDLDIKNKPNKGPKTVQNPSVSDIRYWHLAILDILCILAGLFSAKK